MKRIRIRDEFFIKVRGLSLKEDFGRNTEELKELRPYYYEGVEHLLKLGYSIKGAIKASHEIVMITRETNLSFEDFTKVASRWDKISLYRHL